MNNPYEQNIAENTINRKKQTAAISIPNSINVNIDDYTLERLTIIGH